jgi:hypothetical protein
MFKDAVVVLALIVVTLAACESVAVDPIPVKEPQKIDCDLIFPAPVEVKPDDRPYVS